MYNLCDFRTGPDDYHPSSLSSERALEFVGCSIFGENWLDNDNSIFHPAFRIAEVQKVIINALISGELAAFVIDYPNVGRNDLNPKLFHSHGAYQWLLEGYPTDDRHGSLNIQFEREQIEKFAHKIQAEKSDPAKLTVSAERACEKWLIDLMSGDTKPEKNKLDYEIEAKAKFKGLGHNAFVRAWANAIAQTGNTRWRKAGPRRLDI